MVLTRGRKRRAQGSDSGEVDEGSVLPPTKVLLVSPQDGYESETSIEEPRRKAKSPSGSNARKSNVKPKGPTNPRPSRQNNTGKKEITDSRNPKPNTSEQSRTRRVRLLVPTTLQTISQPAVNRLEEPSTCNTHISQSYEGASTLERATAGPDVNDESGDVTHTGTSTLDLPTESAFRATTTPLESTQKSKSSLVHRPGRVTARVTPPKPYAVPDVESRVQLKKMKQRHVREDVPAPELATASPDPNAESGDAPTETRIETSALDPSTASDLRATTTPLESTQKSKSSLVHRPGRVTARVTPPKPYAVPDFESRVQLKKMKQHHAREDVPTPELGTASSGPNVESGTVATETQTKTSTLDLQTASEFRATTTPQESTQKSKSSLVHRSERVTALVTHPEPYTIPGFESRTQLKKRKQDPAKRLSETSPPNVVDSAVSLVGRSLSRFLFGPNRGEELTVNYSEQNAAKDNEPQERIESDESEVEALLDEERDPHHSQPDGDSGEPAPSSLGIQEGHTYLGSFRSTHKEDQAGDVNDQVAPSSSRSQEAQIDSSSLQSMSEEDLEGDIWGGIFDQATSSYDSEDQMQPETEDDNTGKQNSEYGESGDEHDDISMDSGSKTGTDREMIPSLGDDEDFTTDPNSQSLRHAGNGGTALVNPGPSQHYHVTPQLATHNVKSREGAPTPPKPENVASNSSDPLNAVLAFLGKATGVLERVEQMLTQSNDNRSTKPRKSGAVASDFMRASKLRDRQVRSGARNAPQPREPSVNKARKAMRTYINKKLGRKTARSPPPYAPPELELPDPSMTPFALKAEPMQSSFNALAIRLLVQEYTMKYRPSVPKSDIKDYFTHYLKQTYKRGAKLSDPGKRAEAAKIARHRQRKNKKIVRRMKAAARVPWLKHHVPIISQMGLEAMSSEETIGDGEAFTTHGVPWLSQAAVDLLHGVDDAEEYILRGPHQRRPVPRVPGPLLEHREVKIGLPPNAYNRDFLQRSAIDPTTSSTSKSYDFSIDPGLLREIEKKKAAKAKARR